MSSTNNTRCARLAHHAFDHRTVAEIQKKVIEKSGRNVVSRVFHAKSDKEAIAGWKLDLNRILHIFNVRSVGSASLSLTFPFQTELAINTHMMVSDLHRNALTGADGQYSSVRATLYPSRVNGGMLTISQAHARSALSLGYNGIHNLTFVQYPSRRITSPAAAGLFRTRRSDREARRARRRPHSNRSHRSRGDWEDIHRSGRPPPRSDQATVWMRPSIYPL